MADQSFLEASQNIAGPSTANTANRPMLSTSNLPKLDGSNFQSWLDMITIHLKLRGLDRALIEDGVEELVDLQAKLVLLETMDESHRGQVRGCATSKQVIERLSLVYADKGAANVVRLMYEYYSYKKLQSDSMSVHIGKMDQMRRSLADIGEEQSERLYQVHLIRSLPKEYYSILELWELTHADMQTTPNLVSRLLKKETDLKKLGVEEQALAMRQVQPRRQGYLSSEERRKIIEERKKVTRCNACGRKGHWADECKDVQSRQASNLVTEVNFQAGGNPKLSNQWLLDSGATSHMSRHRDWFTEIEIFETPQSCMAGDGYSLKILGKGTIRIKSQANALTLVLKNVLYIPQLASNLISVGAAADEGVETVFKGNLCEMSKAGMTLARGTKNEREGIYLMAVSTAVDVERVMNMVKKKTLDEWHRVLGHPGKLRLKGILEQLEIEYEAKDEIKCSSCPGGKGQHATHPSVGKLTDTPGVIHSDLAMVNKASFEGEKYFLVCKDEASEFVMVLPIQSKDQVAAKLAFMAIEFETISGFRVRQLKCDNGREFINQTTKLWCLKEKIHLTTSAPYTPQQNGMAEREVRTITEAARTLLLASKLPNELWPEAVHTAAYLKNRLPTTRSRVTPLERLVGQKPKIDHLVEFGTQVHVLKTNYLSKLDTRTEQGHIVGFTGRSNTYKVFIPSRGRVVRTSDVIFAKHEDKTEDRLDSKTIGLESVKITSNQITGEQPAEKAGCSNVSQANLGDSTNDQGPIASTPAARATRIGKNGRPYIDTMNLESFFEGIRELEAACDDQQDEQAINQQDEQAINQQDEQAINQQDEQAISNSNQENTPQNDQQVPDGDSQRDNGQSNERQTQEPDNERAPTPPIRNTSLFNCTQLEKVPSNYHEAVKGPDNEKWKNAIISELKAHERNQTWEIVQRPKRGVALTTKWVFTIKRDNKGDIERYKARLVARGFEQREGIDFKETFSPVVSIESVRSIMALAAAKRLNLLQFDISTAFLNGRVEEEVYVEAPKGIEIGSDKCLKLLKALYGLKQSSRCWNSTFNDALIEIGMRPLETDRCIYQNSDKDIILLIYVDDGLLVGDDIQKCEDIISKLEQKFKLKRMRGECFLGMQIKRTKESFCLYQERYALEILKKFNMEECSPVSAPLIDLDSLLTSRQDQPTKAPYREAVGCIQYLASRTRPDLSFAINFLSRFNQHPTDLHWCALKRVMRYVKGTTDYGLRYECGAGVSIMAYSDADWASDTETRLSTSGSLVLVAGGPVVFSSTKQTSVARSTCEAEYVALSDTARDVVWLKQLYNELGVAYQIPKIRVDNNGAIKMAQRTETSKRSKHISIHYHFVKQLVERKAIEVEKIEGENQLADYLTKPINGPRLKTLVRKSNMKEILSLLVITSLLTTMTNGAYQRVGRTVFIHDTEHTVFRGITKGRVLYSYVVPCKLDTNSPEWNSPNNVKRISVERFKQECNAEVTKAITPTLSKLQKCLPKNRQRGKIRVKRFDPITLTVVGTVIGAGGGGTAAYSWLSADSSYNRLNQKDKLDANQTSEITILKACVAEHNAEMKKAQGIREDIISSSKKHLTFIEENKNATITIAEYGSHIAWQSASNHYIIKADQAHLQALIDSCKKERLSTNAISKLTGAPDFNEWDEDDTYLEQVDQIDDTTFSLTYHVFVRARDTKIYEVADFKVWGNIFDKPTPQTYTGPPFALHNITSNCTLGLGALKKGRVFSNCSVENYRDPSLDEFKAIEADEQTLKEQMRPAIYQNHAGSFIYCFLYKIRIEDRLQECPSYPFFLPILTPFSLLNTTHEVMELNIVQLRGQVEPLSHTVSAIKREDEIEEANKAVTNLFNKNRQATVQEKTGELLSGQSKFILPSTIGIASLLIGMALTFILFKYCSKNDTKEAAVTNNIYNTPAPTIPQPPLPPPPVPQHYYPLNTIYTVPQ